MVMMTRARTMPVRGIEDPEKSKGPATSAVIRPRQVTPLGKGPPDSTRRMCTQSLPWAGWDTAERGETMYREVQASSSGWVPYWFA